MEKEATVIKMYKNYNFFGEWEHLDFVDRRWTTGIPADEVEVNFLSEVKEVLINDGMERAIEYKGNIYRDDNLYLRPNGQVLIKTYRYNDMLGSPSGKPIIIGKVSDKLTKEMKPEAIKAKNTNKQQQGKSRSR